MSRLPNLVELGRRPEKVRYVWVAMMKDGSVKSGATWMTLNRVIEDHTVDGKLYGVRKFKLIDLVNDTVIHLSDSALSFLGLWRKNYFVPKWDWSKEKV